MRPKQFVRAHSMKQEFLIIHTRRVRMSKKKGTGGDKSTQVRDIQRVKVLAQELLGQLPKPKRPGLVKAPR